MNLQFFFCCRFMLKEWKYRAATVLPAETISDLVLHLYQSFQQSIKTGYYLQRDKYVIVFSVWHFFNDSLSSGSFKIENDIRADKEVSTRWGQKQMPPLHWSCLLNQDTETLVGSSKRTPTVSLKWEKQLSCLGITPSFYRVTLTRMKINSFWCLLYWIICSVHNSPVCNWTIKTVLQANWALPNLMHATLHTVTDKQRSLRSQSRQEMHLPKCSHQSAQLLSEGDEKQQQHQLKGQ